MIYQIFIILKIITVQKVLDFFVRLLYNYKVAKIYMERWLSWSKAHDWKSCNGLNPFRGSNPLLSAKKKTIAKAIAFFSYIRLMASYIASQLYLDFVQVIFASRVLEANIISLKTFVLNITFRSSEIYHSVRSTEYH